MGNNIKITDFDSNQYQEAIDLMQANRDHFHDPKVGIFFMNTCDLFGIRKQYIKDIKHLAKNDILMLNILHEDVYKEEQEKILRYREGDKRFFDKCTHGRILYDLKKDAYIIYTDDNNLTRENIRYHIILDEFDIPNNDTIIMYKGKTSSE